MRDMNCYFSVYENGELFMTKYPPCWGGLAIVTLFFGNSNETRTYNTFFAGKDIYIEQFTEPETKDYQKQLIDLINQITPCVFEGKYIKFRLLDTYDQSLILLSFIRNLWYTPSGSGNYIKKFFESLGESTYKDALETLTWANQVACKGIMYNYDGHSNVRADLIVRHSKDLLSWRPEVGYSSSSFLAGRDRGIVNAIRNYF